MQREQLLLDEKRLTTDAVSLHKEVDKNRAECMLRWDELVAARITQDKKAAKHEEAGEKALGKTYKIKEKTRAVFQKYESYCLKEAFKGKNLRYKRLQLFRSLETLERDRLKAQKKSLQALSEAWALTVQKPLPAAETCQQCVQELDIDQDVQDCIQIWLDRYGHPPEEPPFFVPLPCTAEDLLAQHWEQCEAARTALSTGGRALAAMNTHSKIDKTTTLEVKSATEAIRVRSSNIKASLDTEKKDSALSLEGAAVEEEDDDVIEEEWEEEWTYCIQDWHPTSAPSDCLFLDEEDVVIVTQKVDKQWWIGFKVGDPKQRVGKFPAKHVLTVKVPTKTKAAASNDEDDKLSKVGVMDAIRGAVSKKKRRFQKDGYNLDLSYITPRIIAMGFPSEQISGLYRNNLKDVQRFFESRHHDAYMIYNLCSEREYAIAKFKGRVQRWGFDDHNPCPFNIIHPFCKHVDDF
eukprot:g245.t1